MPRNLRVIALLSCGALCSVPLVRAQSVISARSGVIHYVEGDVTIDGELTAPKFAQFPEVKPGQIVATTEGRVELLLTPGVFFRLSENSSARMISTALSDTRLELLSGSALVEVGELLRDNSIAVAVGEGVATFPKKGLYRVDADPFRVRVFDGQASIAAAGRKVNAKKGKEVDLTSPSLAATNFDVKETDAFHRWSGRRTGYIAAANVTSAHVAGRTYRSGFTGGRSTWSWNPYFGMITFLPGAGIQQSPFGPSFYSPATIRVLYIPRLSPPGISFGPPMAGPPVMMGSPRLSSPGSMGAPPASAPGGMVSPRAMSGAQRGR